MPAHQPAPTTRLRVLVDAPCRRKNQGARHVLHWMTSYRRTHYNHALQHAVARAAELDLPLVVFEPLRAGYPHASDRHHAFVVEGMRDTAKRCAAAGVAYLPWIEPEPGAGKGLLARLAQDAALVVTDDWPGFFVPRMLEAAAKAIDTRLEAVDSTGLCPQSEMTREFARAFDFRRHLQKVLAPHLAPSQLPRPDALAGAEALPSLGAFEAPRGWSSPTEDILARGRAALGCLPIDHSVPPVAAIGGEGEGRRRTADFVRARLPRYGEERSEPGSDASSGLSPWIHFGQVSAHELLDLVGRQENWTVASMSGRANGSRDGWWGLGASAEAFMDELVTWRELGVAYNLRHGERHDYEALPEWARRTLDEHAVDRREHLYGLDALEAARTHDPLWNAAQRQLLVEGVIHNYLRMLWGKKVVEWSESPREALRMLIHLNNRWALDGRDPNSLSGIYWCLGRYDRPWAPKREVFGTIRWMSSENTARKFKVKPYLAKHAETGAQAALWN